MKKPFLVPDIGRFQQEVREDSPQLRAEDVLLQAGKRLMQAVQHACPRKSEINLRCFYDQICHISAMPYEGRPATGQLILSTTPRCSPEADLILLDKVLFRDKKLARKTLEMVPSDSALLAGPRSIAGVCKRSAICNKHEACTFVITFHSRDVWSIAQGSRVLMRVKDGEPVHKSPVLDIHGFGNDYVQHFSGTSRTDADHVFGLVSTMIGSQYGGLLIITREAHDESIRLLQRCARVAPMRLHGDLIAGLIRIDGAILMEPTGVCYAVGAILDGRAVGHSRAKLERGSRYNSAVTYIDNLKEPAMAIIVSVDGLYDIYKGSRFEPNAHRYGMDLEGFLSYSPEASDPLVLSQRVRPQKRRHTEPSAR